MDLLVERERIISRHKVLESIPESGFSKDKLSGRPVAFVCDDEIVVVGECVDKVKAGLKKFLERENDPGWINRRNREPIVAQAFKKAKQVTESTANEIRLPQQWWNACLFCLEEVGVDVVLTEGTYG